MPTSGFRLTDNAKSDVDARNLFIAGVIAAILGALGIEVLESGFDAAKGRFAKRKLRSDTQKQYHASPPVSRPETSQAESITDGDRLALLGVSVAVVIAIGATVASSWRRALRRL
jgi:hypothetical protein